MTYACRLSTSLTGGFSPQITNAWIKNPLLLCSFVTGDIVVVLIVISVLSEYLAFGLSCFQQVIKVIEKLFHSRVRYNCDSVMEVFARAHRRPEAYGKRNEALFTESQS